MRSGVRESATRVHTHMHATSGTFRYPSARGFRRGGLTPSDTRVAASWAIPCRRKKCRLVQKSAEKFWRFGKFSYLCRMEAKKWIITGVNRLTHQREQLSRPMDEQEASERLQREIANRKFQRYQPHTRLRMERLEAVQLTLQFQDHE